MKKILACFAVAAILLSAIACQENLRLDSTIPEDGSLPAVLTSLTARIGDDSNTRTSLREDDGKILWDEYDRISVYAGSTERFVFRAAPNTAATSTVFTGEADLSNMGKDDWLYAIYPSSYEDACSGDVLTIPVGGWIYRGTELDRPVSLQETIPHNVYEFPMAARSKDRNLSFYNVCGGIRFTVANDMILRVIFKNKDGRPVSGNAMVSFDTDGLPVIDRIEDGVDEVWTAPYYEDTDYPFFKPGEPFYVTLPPGTYSEGMDVTFRTPSREATYTISGSFDITRSVFSQLKNRDEGLDFKPVDGNIPFERAAFKNYCVQNFDTDGDGEISYAEALAVTSIIFKETDNLGFDFGNLDELMYFENVTRLTLIPSEDSAGKGGLGYMHLHYFPKLQILQCYSNKIENLDFTYTPDLWYLDCGGNRLHSMDVSGLSKLRALYCRNAGLQELILPEDSAIEDLWVDRNNLTSLDLRQQKNLNRLFCYWNPDLSSLDLSDLDKLTLVRCYDCNLTSLDVTGCYALEQLLMQDNNLSDINLADCTGLKYLYYSSNHLPNLDLSAFSDLLELYCSNNQITELDLSHFPNLTELECYSNQLESLDLSSNVNLTVLSCGDNLFETLYVNNNLSLEVLDCLSFIGSYPSDHQFPLKVVYVAEGQEIPALYLPEGVMVLTVGTTQSSPGNLRHNAQRMSQTPSSRLVVTEPTKVSLE